ncbi:UNVERIFIED_CONTAM: hypothetical protein GTU68_046743 [Idotea baltica]|nr:hypothetical protein [Idotea baltica]
MRAVKNRRRAARGIGSGKGKTAERAPFKGQKVRSGRFIKGLKRRSRSLPGRLRKKCFNNIFAKKFKRSFLGRIQTAIDAGQVWNA